MYAKVQKFTTQKLQKALKNKVFINIQMLNFFKKSGLIEIG